MIYNLSLSFGGLWYLDDNLFTNDTIRLRDGSIEFVYEYTLKELQKNLTEVRKYLLKIIEVDIQIQRQMLGKF